MTCSWATFFPRILFCGLAFVLHLAGANASASQEGLTAGEKLRKLSLVLRGIEPDENDIRWAMSLQAPGQLTNYLSEKALEYTSSVQFTAKIIEHLNEELRLEPTGKPYEWLWQLEGSQNLSNQSYADSTGRSMSRSTLNLMIKQMIESDLTWDYLLKSRTFLLSPKGYGETSDRDSFKNLFDTDFYYGSSGKEAEVISKTLPEADPRAAGFLGLSTFTKRYPVNVDGNYYSRAAAILRTFMCENLKPAVLAQQEDLPILKGLREAALIHMGHGAPETGSSAAPTVSPISPKDELARSHASNPQCMSCHRKLNPLSDLYLKFERSTYGPEAIGAASPGGLLSFDGAGNPYLIKASGLGEIGKVITARPEYAACQVKKIWSWFVPGQSTISDDKLKSAIAVFNREDRKPRKFVQWLTQQPEFFLNSPQSAETPLISKVRQIFTSCYSCHQGAQVIPDFRDFLTRPSKVDAQWITRILKATDAEHDGVNGRMPPQKLQADEYQAIVEWAAEWTAQWTVDGTGQGTAHLGESSPKGSPAKKATTRSWACLPTTHDFARRLAKSFPVTFNKKVMSVGYEKINEVGLNLNGLFQGFQMSKFTGRVDPLTGERLYSRPEAGFVDWFTAVVQNLTRLEIGSAVLAGVAPQNYLTGELMKLAPLLSPDPRENRYIGSHDDLSPMGFGYFGGYDGIGPQWATRVKWDGQNKAVDILPQWERLLQLSWSKLTAEQQVDLVFHMINQTIPEDAIRYERVVVMAKRVLRTLPQLLTKDRSLGQALFEIKHLIMMSGEYLLIDPLCERG